MRSFLPFVVLVSVVRTAAGQGPPSTPASPRQVSASAASHDNTASPAGPIERLDDPHVPPAALRARPTTPSGTITFNGFTSVQVNVDADGNNIVGDAANEPSIAVDPAHPNRMAIGWRQFDTVVDNFRQAGWGYSSNGGRTWIFPGVLERGVFRSDPVLEADADGTFYYNSLTTDGNTYWCNVFKSTNGGRTWDAGIYAYGGDKPWMAIDRTGGIGHGNI